MAEHVVGYDLLAVILGAYDKLSKVNFPLYVKTP